MSGKARGPPGSALTIADDVGQAETVRAAARSALEQALERRASLKTSPPR
jgi:hypothetical protein